MYPRGKECTPAVGEDFFSGGGRCCVEFIGLGDIVYNVYTLTTKKVVKI